MERTGDGDTRRRARKRGHGEGTVYQRKDGRWIAELMVGRRPDGKRDVRTVSAPTRAEVQRKLSALRAQAQQGLLGDVTAARDTVGGFLARWLEATRSTERPRTWARYGEIVRLHLAPALGGQKLSALQPDALQRLYAAKLTAGLAPRTVHHVHTVLHTALAQAERWGYVSRNVAATVDPPAVPRKELRPPTSGEVRTLLDAAAARGDRLGPLWTVAVYSGCREGELLGLQWEDVDLQRGTLAVRRTLVDASGTVPRFGEPKTGRSRRTVTLPPEAVSALRGQRERQDRERALLGPRYAEHRLVFASHRGTPLLASNVIRSFKATLVRVGLPAGTRIHDLRHAAATLLLQAGVHPKVVSERLGHSTIGITMDLYTHAVEGLDADAAARMQHAVRGDRPPAALTSPETGSGGR